jgi:hypothetical protein
VELEGVEEVLVLWIEATLRMSHTISWSDMIDFQRDEDVI